MLMFLLRIFAILLLAVVIGGCRPGSDKAPEQNPEPTPEQTTAQEQKPAPDDHTPAKPEPAPPKAPRTKEFVNKLANADHLMAKRIKVTENLIAAYESYKKDPDKDRNDQQIQSLRNLQMEFSRTVKRTEALSADVRDEVFKAYATRLDELDKRLQEARKKFQDMQKP